MVNELNNFCNNIRRLRSTSNMTQKEFASLMGISVSSIRKLEKGEFPPRLGVQAMFRIQFAFHIPVRDLLKPSCFLEDTSE